MCGFESQARLGGGVAISGTSPASAGGRPESRSERANDGEPIGPASAAGRAAEQGIAQPPGPPARSVFDDSSGQCSIPTLEWCLSEGEAGAAAMPNGIRTIARSARRRKAAAMPGR